MLTAQPAANHRRRLLCLQLFVPSPHRGVDGIRAVIVLGPQLAKVVQVLRRECPGRGVLDALKRLCRQGRGGQARVKAGSAAWWARVPLRPHDLQAVQPNVPRPFFCRLRPPSSPPTQNDSDEQVKGNERARQVEREDVDGCPGVAAVAGVGVALWRPHHAVPQQRRPIVPGGHPEQQQQGVWEGGEVGVGVQVLPPHHLAKQQHA